MLIAWFIYFLKIIIIILKLQYIKNDKKLNMNIKWKKTHL